MKPPLPLPTRGTIRWIRTICATCALLAPAAGAQVLVSRGIVEVGPEPDTAVVRLPVDPAVLSCLEIPPLSVPASAYADPAARSARWVEGPIGPLVTLRATVYARRAEWPARLVRLEGAPDDLWAVALVRDPLRRTVRHLDTWQPPLTPGMGVEVEFTACRL